MRSFLLILATLIVLGAGAGVYVYLQPPAARKLAHPISASNKQRPQLEHTMRGVGQGENPWVKSMDAKTGEIKSQMRGQVWDPQPDNSVNVTRPQAEFFSSDGKQRIRIDGTDGNILMPPSPDSNKPAKLGQSGPTGMPSRGKLHNVVISIFEPVDATEPQLVARMNNAAFDTDLFHIATEAFKDAKGNTIEADRVPVTLRGRDYDFDGEGLVINWNERDRKLQLLEVAHGKSLVIKNPSALGHSDLVPSTQPTSEAPPSALPAIEQPTTPRPSAAVLGEAPPRAVRQPDMLASTDPHAHNLILTAAKPKKPPPKSSAAARRKKPVPTTVPTTKPKNYRDLSPVVYCATFERDVRVFEQDSPHPDEPVASGDQMKIYFLQVPEKSAATQPSASASPPPNSSAKSSARPSSKPATHPSTRPVRSTTRRADATSQPGDRSPTTQQSPITVKWKGKLRVVPVEGPADSSMAPGKAIVHLTGAPTRLDQRGMKAECGEAVFNAAQNSARLYPRSTTQPIVMHTDEGWIVHTEKRVEYDEDPKGPHVATLVGHSTANIPVESDVPGAASFMNSSWSDTCKLHMVNVDGRTVMEQVDLLGDVVVDHPKLNLTSSALALKFDPTTAPTTRHATSQPTTEPTTQPATRSASLAVSQTTTEAATRATTRPTTSPSNAVTATLREIIASGNADCIIKDPQDQREIKSQTLDVQVAESPDHQMYAKVVDADGDVHATEKGSSMTAGHLTAHLAPATRPTTQATTKPTTEPIDTASATTLPTTLATSRPTARHSTTQDFGGNVRLESMVATDNVVLKTDDGTTAQAAELHAQTVGDQLSYELIGKPNAIITSTKGNNGKTVIAGPVIQFDPQQNIARVVGGGSGQGSNPNNPTQLMNLTWTGDAIVDGNTNLIDVDQNVVVVSHDADGTVDTATSRHLQAIMTTRPSTQPTTKPTTAAASLAVSQTTTQPTTLASTRPSKSKNPDDTTSSFMKDKEITAGILTGHVAITSELKNPDDTPARKMNLFAEKVIYDSAAGRLDIPVKGTLLYQDHRQPTTQALKAAKARAASKPADDQNSPNMGSGKGNTAFSWDDSLVYERALKTMTMTGNVIVVQQPDSAGDAPFTLKSEVLTATFEPKPTTKPATQSTTESTTQSTEPSTEAATPATSVASSRPTSKPTSKPTTRPEEDLGQLKLITATGNVHATSTLLNFDAPQMTFDPVNQIITATGDPRHPVSFFHSGSGARTLASKLYWNTVTDEIKMEKVIGTLQRK